MVDIRLIVFAACQAARSALPYVKSEYGEAEAEHAIELAERWVADQSSVLHDELGGAADLVDEAYGQGERIIVLHALRAAAQCARAAFDAVRSWGHVADRAWIAVDSASAAHHAAVTEGLADELVNTPLIVRTVIPYPRRGNLVAMGPGFYVVQPPKNGWAEDVLGLQQVPRKISGRWWDGYTEGPVLDVIQMIPDERAMRDVYESIVMRKRS
jgi:hypothetical protein